MADNDECDYYFVTALMAGGVFSPIEYNSTHIKLYFVMIHLAP